MNDSNQSNKQKPTPEQLGYPANYNPYKTQKMRFKKLLKQTNDALSNLELLGATFMQFEEHKHSETMMLFHTALSEYRQTLIEWWNKDLMKFDRGDDDGNEDS